MGNEEIIILKSELYDFLVEGEFVKYKVQARNIKDKAKRLDDCMDSFEKMEKRILSNKSYLKVIKDMVCAKYISKPEDLAIQYLYPLQKQYCDTRDIHINIIHPVTEIDHKLRKKHIEAVICEHQDEFHEIILQQKLSLNVWLDYLLSESSNNLSILMKLWILCGVLKTGNINKIGSAFAEFDLETVERCVELIGNENYNFADGTSFSNLYCKMIGRSELVEDAHSNGINY